MNIVTKVMYFIMFSNGFMDTYKTRNRKNMQSCTMGDFDIGSLIYTIYNPCTVAFICTITD